MHTCMCYVSSTPILNKSPPSSTPLLAPQANGRCFQIPVLRSRSDEAGGLVRHRSKKKNNATSGSGSWEPSLMPPRSIHNCLVSLSNVNDFASCSCKWQSHYLAHVNDMKDEWEGKCGSVFQCTGRKVHAQFDVRCINVIRTRHLGD
jgi:hypothetical protein